MKTLVLILLLIGPVFGQLDYAPTAKNKEAAVKMHFAIRLFRGATQEEFLLKAIHNRKIVSEEEAKQIFTREELKQTFFNIGGEDVTVFRRLYDAPTIAQKKAIWRNLLYSERIDVRRINFAWGVGYLGLNEIQTEYLLRFSKALPKITKDQLDVFQIEATTLFTKEQGTLLFGSIGPYSACYTSGIEEPEGGCPCSIGSSFNMSCNNDCSSPGGSCTVTSDGCGFAWLYPCDGTCTRSHLYRPRRRMDFAVFKAD